MKPTKEEGQRQAISTALKKMAASIDTAFSRLNARIDGVPGGWVGLPEWIKLRVTLIEGSMCAARNYARMQSNEIGVGASLGDGAPTRTL